ncbi:glycerophosphoryl diester phosphodiesterase membrane domain-containing protein [Streptomyces sp. NPDC004609]|uniref:DUF7544 domain-containing protein n=1 Tax=Streptomyces sp. NPDC004609 TaxID=3364704 RepID=UPI0036755825
MNDTPGWASPGSAPSDGQDANVPRPSEPADQTGPASKWSREQPPAGQWSAPSAPEGGGTPGPPQPGPGWGGTQPHGWGPPPAAKPGVIPLRPLGMGEILDGAVSTLRAHWRTVLGITISVSVIAEIGNILAARYLLPDPVELDPDADSSEALRQVGDSLQSSTISLGPVMLITMVATLFTTALLTMVISRSVLGQPVKLSEAWREARPRLPQLLGLTLLLPLIGAAIVAVAILPGLLLGGGAGMALAVLGGLASLGVVLWLMIRFALASPALMLERQGVFASMRRSAKLVQGAWWRTFGIIALTMLLTLLVSMIISVPFGLVAVAMDSGGFSDFLNGEAPDFGWAYLIISGIGAVIASSITYPISAGVTVLLYVDQRIRREALDLELGRAAGLPGYGSEPPGNAPRS